MVTQIPGSIPLAGGDHPSKGHVRQNPCGRLIFAGGAPLGVKTIQVKLIGLLFDKISTCVYTKYGVINLETAKIFTHGGSQAVRLPKSCRFPSDEVAVKKVGAIVMLYQKDKALDNFLQCEPFTDDVYGAILEARREDAEYAATMMEGENIAITAPAFSPPK